MAARTRRSSLPLQQTVPDTNYERIQRLTAKPL
jgi:hypothetical protein